MSKLPQFVPLPELPHYTDSVRFGDIGLQNDSDVLVNPEAFRRVQELGGLGIIKIAKKSIRVTPTDWSEVYDIDDTEPVEPKPLSTTKVRFPEGSSFYGPANVRIKIHTKVVDDEVRAIELEDGQFDPALRVRVLNLAVKLGLFSAVRQANVDQTKLMQSMFLYTPIAGWFAQTPAAAPWWPTVMLAMGPLANVISASSAAVTQEESVAEYVRDHRKSLFFGVAFDRIIAGSAAVALNTFIKAK